MAKEYIKRFLNSNETTFSFKKYITKMKQTFNGLENYNVPLYEEEKVRQPCQAASHVRQLLDNINCPKQRFEN